MKVGDKAIYFFRSSGIEELDKTLQPFDKKTLTITEIKSQYGLIFGSFDENQDRVFPFVANDLKIVVRGHHLTKIFK
jgi:hypothetical protein